MNIEELKKIGQYFRVLNDREKNILLARAGFVGECPATLETVGKKLNLSRQRTQQIERRALDKINILIKFNSK